MNESGVLLERFGKDFIISNQQLKEGAYANPKFFLCSISPIGNPKFGLFTLLHGQNSSSPCTAISAMLDSKGRAFVLIQVLYSCCYTMAIWNYCVV